MISFTFILFTGVPDSISQPPPFELNIFFCTNSSIISVEVVTLTVYAGPFIGVDENTFPTNENRTYRTPTPAKCPDTRPIFS